MNIKLMPVLTFLGLSILLSGCLFPASQSAINYYDLDTPQTAPSPEVRIIIEGFENLAGCSDKMRYRIDRNRQVFDEQNKWVQSPEEMLSRYLSASLTGNTSGKSYRLRGKLEVFEIDLHNETVSMQCSFTIFQDGSDLKLSQTYRKTIELKKKSPQEFAEAFSATAAGLAEEIKKISLNSIK